MPGKIKLGLNPHIPLNDCNTCTNRTVGVLQHCSEYLISPPFKCEKYSTKQQSNVQAVRVYPLQRR